MSFALRTGETPRRKDVLELAGRAAAARVKLSPYLRSVLGDVER